jgi:hypothetical protein
VAAAASTSGVHSSADSSAATGSSRGGPDSCAEAAGDADSKTAAARNTAHLPCLTLIPQQYRKARLAVRRLQRLPLAQRRCKVFATHPVPRPADSTSSPNRRKPSIWRAFVR